jgi:hypothetical protein
MPENIATVNDGLISVETAGAGYAGSRHGRRDRYLVDRSTGNMPRLHAVLPLAFAPSAGADYLCVRTLTAEE